jgi:1,2-phenylacetyl-CoA epoxidase catalytic subunit
MTTSTSNPTESVALEWMASQVASLADNKAALGRAYAEWAVSAPSLESAVAAAAMAQDELGHARSTYPLLKQLAPDWDGGEEDVETGRNLALLDGALSDWSAVIAANAVVDGALSTFVASSVDSSIPQLAQRARKILQEERSHKIHAEAWTRRLCRAGEPQQALLIQRLREAWDQAGRWIGPDDDPGIVAAVELEMLDRGAAEQRQAVRSWLIELLASEGMEIEFEEPSDWSLWDPVRRRWTP